MSRIERLAPLITLIVLVGAGAWYLTSLCLESGIQVALKQALEGSYNTFFLGILMLMGGVFCSLADDDPPAFYNVIMLCFLASPFAILLLMGLYYYPSWTIPGLGVVAVLIGILCSRIDTSTPKNIGDASRRSDGDDYPSEPAYIDGRYHYPGGGGDYFGDRSYFEESRSPEPPIDTYTSQEGGCGYGRHHRG